MIVAFATRMSAMSIGRRRTVSDAWNTTSVQILSFSALDANNLQEHKHCLQPGCDFDGPDQAALRDHLKKDHFQCEGCMLILPSSTKLNLHYENCKFTVTCHQCGETCAGQAKLATHLEKCYFCEECGYQTYHEGNYHIVSRVRPRTYGVDIMM